MSKVDNVTINQERNSNIYFIYSIDGDIKCKRKLTDKEFLELYAYFNYNLSVSDKIKKIHERNNQNGNSNN